MTIQKTTKTIISAMLIATISFLTSCLTSKKIDRFVGKQYNNELPKQEKRKNADISITTSVNSYTSENISTTGTKTSDMLPLVFYWQWDYKNTCTLNPAIAINTFTKSVYFLANKGLNQKLNGQKLELTVEQIPNIFAIDDKAHLIWIIYAFGWDKVSVQPDLKDLIVSYKYFQNDGSIKSGSITIKNNVQNKNLRFFQSWKSATSEYLTQYNDDITNMTKAFVTKLIQEL
jgi:hypothetical protein